MCCLASQGYPSPSFKSNIFPSGWILGSGLVSLRISTPSIWGGLRCGLLLGFCGGLRLRFPENLQHLRVGSGVGSSWALVGSGDVSMRIYSVWGGLRCGLLWVPATFLVRIYSIWGGLRRGLPGSCGFQRRRFNENLQHFVCFANLLGV